MSSKSLIIGSNGYLGSNMAWFLHEKGESFQCFDTSKEPGESWMPYNQLDITNEEDVNQLDFECDFIYMYAGITGTDQGFSQIKTFFEINVLGLGNLLNAMKNASCRARIIFPSTRLVYAGNRGVLIKEDDLKEPKTVYALNKMACEYLLNMYANTFDINYTVFRIGVPYGHIVSNKYSYGTIGFFFSKAEKGENITLYGEGSVKRTFTHVEDICSGIYSAVHKDISNRKVFNIGGEVYSLFEIAIKVASVYDSEVSFVDWPEISGKIESGDTMFDSSLLDELIGYDKKSNLDEWINAVTSKN